MCYNLKLLENGEPELDFSIDPADIRLSDPEGSDTSDAKFVVDHDIIVSLLT